MEISWEIVFKLLSMIGVAGAFIWKAVDSIIKRKIERQEKADQYRIEKEDELERRKYQQGLKLEREKVELQKELEQTRRRHVQKMIDEIKNELGKMNEKVDVISESFARMEGRMEGSAKAYEQQMEILQKLVVETEEKMKTVMSSVAEFHMDVAQYRTEIVNINKDLIMVRDFANKLRARQKNK